MKCLGIFIVILVGCSALPSGEQLYAQWTKFKETHQKSYNSLEELQRFNVFISNLKRIEEHNKLFAENKVTYKMGMNKFGDMTQKEFVQFLKASSQKKRPTFPTVVTYTNSKIQDVPEEIDWRDQNAVSPVKDQGQCGSCWAFSVTGGLESANYLKTNKMVTVSEQELVDCDRDWNAGCNGGDMEPAYEYVIKHGIASDTDYPYEARDRSCRRDDIPSAINITKYIHLPVGDEEQQKVVVGTIGPVSIGIDATHWQLYESGVFYDDDCETADELLNHGVLAAGYGSDNGNDYWLVKNSWGESWGENGYIRAARNKDNNCGIATDSSYPLVGNA